MVRVQRYTLLTFMALLFFPSMQVAISRAQEAPVKLHEARGYEVEWHHWSEVSCGASWDEECEDTEAIDVPAGYTYCNHQVLIKEQNNASFQVVTSANRVSLRVHTSGSGNFWDKWGGNFRYILVVGLISTNRLSPGLCAPSRTWVKHCHGRSLGACYYDSRCATLDAISILRDQQCRQNEGYSPTPVLQTPRPGGTFTPR